MRALVSIWQQHAVVRVREERKAGMPESERGSHTLNIMQHLIDGDKSERMSVCV